MSCTRAKLRGSESPSQQKSCWLLSSRPVKSEPWEAHDIIAGPYSCPWIVVRDGPAFALLWNHKTRQTFGPSICAVFPILPFLVPLAGVVHTHCESRNLLKMQVERWSTSNDRRRGPCWTRERGWRRAPRSRQLRSDDEGGTVNSSIKRVCLHLSTQDVCRYLASIPVDGDARWSRQAIQSPSSRRREGGRQP